ncbi:MAG: MFS transporter [Oscillospiraceae bacterium]
MPATSPKKYQIIIYFIVTVLFWCTLFSYVPIFSPYLNSIGLTYSTIGLIGGAYGIAQLVVRIPLGFFSDRIGKRKIFIVLGVFFGTFSAFLLGFTSNGFLLTLGRFSAGIAASAWVIFTVLFSSYFQDDKAASYISYINVANVVGVFIAKLMGSLLAEAFGYRAAFVVGGCAGLVALVLSAFIAENPPPSLQRASFRTMLGVLRDKNLLIMSLLGILNQIVLFATIHTFTPQKAVNAGGSPADLAILSVCTALPSIVCTLFCSWLFGRKPNLRNLVVLAFAFQVVGTLITGFATTVPMVFIGGIIAGTGFSTVVTSLLSFCTLTVEPAKRGFAMGVYQALYSIGLFVGPVILGTLSDLVGLNMGFALVSIISAVGGVLAFLLLGYRRQ